MPSLTEQVMMPGRWRATVLITVAAVAGYALVRWLPLSVDPLHYTDFHADGKSFLEFCEPGSPQFVPVDRMRSPVEMQVKTRGVPKIGETVRGTVHLATSAGKPVTAESLLVVHTQKLHLLVVDETLDEYHHLHPTATDEPGVFAFEFTPRNGGLYRLFGDFTPRATGRGLYAGADLVVQRDASVMGGTPSVEPRLTRIDETEGIVFELFADVEEIRINEPADLTLRVARADGEPVALDEIMGAKAHMVGFDVTRSGFAHLHPAESVQVTEGAAEDLGFTLLLTDPGYYRLWAQVKIDGIERFGSFGLKVLP